MTPAELAEAHRASQLRQAEAAAILTRRAWRQMDADDMQASWSRIVAKLVAILGFAQLGAAKAGAAYATEVLGESDSTVNPSRWSGVASDGRALDTLLYSAVIRSLRHVGAGESPAEALQAGQKWLDALVRTQVADAGRGATGAAITARPRAGYVRVISVPCCQRCAVLAGKTFRWNEGFLRHPKCQCRHLPADAGTLPDGYSGDVNPDQIRDLTRAQREAVSDGADLNQVINAHRAGRRSADGMTTSEGTTRRGVAGSRGRSTRLTPEGIYRVSATREEAIERLRQNGYLL